jgi:AraC-like DNA-binding protein
MRDRLRQVFLQYERLWALDRYAYGPALEKMWGCLGERNGLLSIGLHLGAQFNLCEHPYAALILTSTTLRQALEHSVRFHNTFNPHTRYELRSTGSDATLSIHHERDAGAIRQDTEFRLSFYVSLVNWFAEEGRGAAAVRLRSAPCSNGSEFRQVLKCPVAYGQMEDAVVVGADALNTPIWGSERVAELVRRQAAQLPDPASPPATLQMQVAAAIRAGLAKHRSGIKSVATEFGATPRTLQRRLAEDGVTYRAIQDNERVKRCLELLEVPGITMAALADLLGYSNASSFRRAFCRWFGQDPETALPGGDAVAGTDSNPAAPPMPTSRTEQWRVATGAASCLFVSPSCPGSCPLHPAHLHLSR